MRREKTRPVSATLGGEATFGVSPPSGGLIVAA